MGFLCVFVFLLRACGPPFGSGIRRLSVCRDAHLCRGAARFDCVRGRGRPEPLEARAPKREGERTQISCSPSLPLYVHMYASRSNAALSMKWLTAVCIWAFTSHIAYCILHIAHIYNVAL